MVPGCLGVPVGPPGWVVDRGTATEHVSPLLTEPLGSQIRAGRWYLLAHFLYQN